MLTPIAADHLLTRSFPRCYHPGLVGQNDQHVNTRSRLPSPSTTFSRMLTAWACWPRTAKMLTPVATDYLLEQHFQAKNSQDVDTLSRRPLPSTTFSRVLTSWACWPKPAKMSTTVAADYLLARSFPESLHLGLVSQNQPRN